MTIIAEIGQALAMSAGMVWDVGWSLVLGFVVSGLIQAVVPQDRISRHLGGGLRAIALATALGAASSSCSYASAAISRTLFKRGASLTASLAFLFAATNLVLELGVVLYVLLGWQFVAAEWIGGVVLVAIMALLVRLTCPAGLVDAARRHQEAGSDHDTAMPCVAGGTLGRRLRNPALAGRVAQSFVMDLRMVWKDLAIGFLIAGVLAVFVPSHWWATLFLQNAPSWMRGPANALIGPLVAMVSFVCSIGNVPLAAVLWRSGISLGGVLSFLYADLIVLPLLNVYRRYYGWRMAAYIGGVFFSTMALAGWLMDLLFTGAGLAPALPHGTQHAMHQFHADHTLYLNLAFGVLAVWLAIKARQAAETDQQALPARRGCCH